MTSNLTAGERRWASARRTGMTVLGKVAVPKPLNLPSQRLENHGLDPNVEIVPKGSLGWGSRSSSASNPWGSSTLSPNADGGASSASQLSGRPLSAGSGSRPSTAGSDRTVERATNAWGPTSRPASASGVVPSNQPSATSRPHSAETRPSSSQLSRFAEPLSESSARAPITTVEKVGGISSESDRFSLASGDFPTLNSSKDVSSKFSEPQDRGPQSRPNSASGKIGNTEASEADAHIGTFSSWNRDGPQNVDDGIQPGPSQWHGEPQQYHNGNMPPPQFDAWRGPSVNSPAGVWYRGPTGGPPYGAQAGPGGFHVEPFPYYYPQIPGPPSANSQPVPGSGAGPRGHHHQNNGELYRPQMADAFAHSGMPFRPGFYRGPMPPYDGYYGPPPVGYRNSGEREGPFKGMAGPSVHNRYSTPNAFDSGHSHHRPGRNDSAGKMLTDHERSTRPGDGPWQGKVLSRQHNEWEGKDNTGTTERVPINNTSNTKKVGRTDVVPRTREWGAELDSEEDMYASGTREGENVSYHSSHDQVGLDSEAGEVKPSHYIHKSVVGSAQINQKVTPASTPGMLLQTPAVMKRGSVVPATAKDSTLMQKIEVLNVKVRGSVDTNDSAVLTKVGNDASVPCGKVPASNTGALANERISNFRDRTSQPAFTSRRPSDHMHGEDNNSVIGRLQSPDNHGRQMKPLATELPGMATGNISPSSHVHASNYLPVVADTGYSSGNNEDSSADTLDTKDNQAQRAKMREFAKQRAIQLQKEEEERIREQKAKALAKLEELNRRVDSSNSGRAEIVLGPTEQEVEEKLSSELSILGAKPDAAKPASALNFGDISQICVGTVPLIDTSSALAAHFSSERTKGVTLEPAVSDGQSLAVKEEIPKAAASELKGVLHVNEAGVSRHKRNSFKPKQNVQPNYAKEQLQVVFASDAPKDDADVTSKENNLVALGEVTSREGSNLPRNTAVAAETPAQQRKKNYNSRKHKPDEAAPTFTSSPIAVTETRPIKACFEIDSLNNIQSDLDSCSAQGSATVGVDSSKEQSSVHGEEVQGRVINHRKPQQRRFSRNQQSNRPLDKFHGNDNVIWAPVKSQTKSDQEINQQIVQVSITSAKSDTQVQSNTKGKRAEMERYVPKPVAKELAEQVSIQQPDLNVSGLASDESTQKVDSGLQIQGGLETGISATRNAAIDSRECNKQGKLHGAWRQRGLAETPSRGSSPFTSNTSKNARPVVGHHSIKPEVVTEKVVRDSNTSENCNVSADTDAAIPATAISVRDQIATGKGKRHSVKADKRLGSSHGREKNSISMEADKNHTQFSDSDIRHSEKISVPRESRGTEERVSSQWQPKSHPSTNHSYRSGRSSSGPEVASERSGTIRKGFASQSRFHAISNAKEIGENDFSESVDQSVPENKTSEMVNVGHQGHRKERRIPTIKGPPYSQNELTVTSEESASAMSADGQFKLQSSFDIKRSRNQNIHPSSSRDSHGDWGQERQRHNSHYEYLPVGLHNNRNPERIEDGSHNVGPRYKDQNQSQSRRGRGNFNGRQSSSIRVDAGSS